MHNRYYRSFDESLWVMKFPSKTLLFPLERFWRLVISRRRRAWYLTRVMDEASTWITLPGGSFLISSRNFIVWK
jgi:hypothetical protein